MKKTILIGGSVNSGCFCILNTIENNTYKSIVEPYSGIEDYGTKCSNCLKPLISTENKRDAAKGYAAFLR